MIKYCYLDAHAALHHVFQSDLANPDKRIIVGEEYLAEMTRWEGGVRRVEHLRRLASIGHRVYYAVDEAFCVSQEHQTLTRTDRSKILLNSGTRLLRDALADPLQFDRYFSEQEMQTTIAANDYNDPDLRPWWFRMVSDFARLFRQHGIRRSGVRNLTDEELKSIVGAGRLFVRDQLINKGIPDYKALRFCLKDSCSLRRHICILSRIYDWTLRNGIEGLSEQQIYAEQADMRHLVLASYFDYFLTDDEANQRADRNLRRAIILGKTDKHIATVAEH